MKDYQGTHQSLKNGFWYRALVNEKRSNHKEKAVFVYAFPDQNAYHKYCRKAPAYRFRLLLFHPLNREQTKKVDQHIIESGGENLLSRTRRNFYIIDNPAEIQLDKQQNF